MTLANRQIKQYRSLAHSLQPVVTIGGKGLNDAVIKEINRALEDHELIKIKLAIADRELRKSLVAQLCQHCTATPIQEIGKVAVVFREAAKPDPRKSNIR